MIQRSVRLIALANVFFLSNFVNAESPVILDPIAFPAPVPFDQDSLDIAELVIKLSRGIVNDIQPPSQGAERLVTRAIMSTDRGLRTYEIEGKDVYHTGRVLSTFRIRLQKHVQSTNNFEAARALSPEAIEVLEALLNVLHDVADFQLDHQKILLDNYVASAPAAEDELKVFELQGVNEVCEHTELNTFKITITRFMQGRRAFYEVQLIKPYSPER